MVPDTAKGEAMTRDRKPITMPLKSIVWLEQQRGCIPYILPDDTCEFCHKPLADGNWNVGHERNCPIFIISAFLKRAKGECGITDSHIRKARGKK